MLNFCQVTPIFCSSQGFEGTQLTVHISKIPRNRKLEEILPSGHSNVISLV